ncbi:hypothetical protein QVD99_000179 [Batrachochytrium dendrobatidis]|nr:hypothetical protein QVD99_000179 [Batrachochytrium dendrobatidis]
MSHESQLRAQNIVLKRALLDHQQQQIQLNDRILQLENLQKAHQLNGSLAERKNTYGDQLKRMSLLASIFWTEPLSMAFCKQMYLDALQTSDLGIKLCQKELKCESLLFSLFSYVDAIATALKLQGYPLKSATPDCVDFMNLTTCMKIRTIRLCFAKANECNATRIRQQGLSHAIHLVTYDINIILDSLESNIQLQETQLSKCIAERVEFRSLNLLAQLHRKINSLYIVWMACKCLSQELDNSALVLPLAMDSSPSYWRHIMSELCWDKLQEDPQMHFLLSIWEKLNGHLKTVSYHATTSHAETFPTLQKDKADEFPNDSSDSLEKVENTATLQITVGNEHAFNVLDSLPVSLQNTVDIYKEKTISNFQEAPLNAIRIQQLSVALEKLHSKLSN